jgi:hypothetical protein
MDFQEARDRRRSLPPEPGGDRQAVVRKRAADARLRRAIRDALARQRSTQEPEPDSEPSHPPLRVVGNAGP